MNLNQRLQMDRERANFAFECANDESLSDKDIASKYRTNVRKFPMMVKNNGLCASVAFAYSKSIKSKSPERAEAKAWKSIYSIIRNWLKVEPQQFIGSKFHNDKDDDELMKVLTNEGVLNFDEYRFATLETLALFSWLKRFVGEEDGSESKKENN